MLVLVEYDDERIESRFLERPAAQNISGRDH